MSASLCAALLLRRARRSVQRIAKQQVEADPDKILSIVPFDGVVKLFPGWGDCYRVGAANHIEQAELLKRLLSNFPRHDCRVCVAPWATRQSAFSEL